MATGATLVAVVLLVIGSAAAAGTEQLSEKSRETFEGPTRFLMTKQEHRTWKKVDSEEEAQRFIELFWARRDPDLSTRINEFKEQFDLRIRIADQRFGYGNHRGATSDRGQVLILLGPAEEVHYQEQGSRRGESRFSDVQAVPGSRRGRGISYTEEGAREAWKYRLESFPGRDLEGEVFFVFVEGNPGKGDFFLAGGLRGSSRALKLLDDAPSWYLVNPDLQEVPEFSEKPRYRAEGVIIDSNAKASNEQLAWLAAGSPWAQHTRMAIRPGLADRPRHFLWVQLLLPEQAPVADLTVGRVRNGSSGEEAFTFSAPVHGVVLRGGRAYELAIPVAEGEWQVQLALAGAGEPLTAMTMNAATATTSAGTTFSPLYWGCEVTKVENATAGSPFVIGSWLIHPRADHVYLPGDELAYAAYVFNPLLGSGGEPNIELVTALLIQGQETVRTPPQPAHLTRVAEDVWVLENLVPLDMFTRTGYYRLRIELTQPDDGATSSGEIPIRIIAPPQQLEQSGERATVTQSD